MSIDERIRTMQDHAVAVRAELLQAVHKADNLPDRNTAGTRFDAWSNTVEMLLKWRTEGAVPT